MIIHRRDIRREFEGRTREAMRNGTDMAGYRQGAVQFLREWHDTLGVRIGSDLRPGFHTDGQGRYYKAQGSAQASEVSLRDLAEAICGHDFVEDYFHPNNGLDFGNRHLLEAAIDPTAFLNVSVFNLAVAGLVNAEIIEKFENPEYIGRNLVTIKPTKMNGQKFIGVARVAPVDSASKGRKPGETHAEVGFTEQYKTSPETVEQALKVVVTKEATYFDYTGQVLDTAGDIGDELAYGQDKAIADEFIGVTNSYNFVGTSYNTYQTASPFVNDQSNPFSDETDVDDARQLFVGMTDPITGREIKVIGRDILCTPARELKFRQNLFGTNVQVGTQLNSNFPSRWTTSGVKIGEVLGGAYTVTAMTNIWFNRLTAADGLALSAANAKEYWWIGDHKKAFYWMENWPLTPWQASADELTMKDRGLIAVYGANYRGVVYTFEPRYIVRNKN